MIQTDEQKMTFKTWYNSLSKKDKAEFRVMFLAKAQLGYPSFYSKLGGYCRFSGMEQEFIINYSGKDLVFPEKK